LRRRWVAGNVGAAGAGGTAKASCTTGEAPALLTPLPVSVTEAARVRGARGDEAVA